ncbi:MAG: RHS repeat-associated core domain-containing protein, partial [Planctomycetota bacterium]
GQPYQLGYTYDENQRLETLTYPSGRVVTFNRDAIGRIGSVTLNDNGTVTTLADQFEYRPFGPATDWTLGNGLETKQAFDQQYRLTRVHAETTFDRTLGYDDVGNVLTLANGVDVTHNQTFTYDDLDRLETAAGGYGTREFDYDKIGNRLFAGQTGTTLGLMSPLVSTIRDYGEHNRLTEVRENGVVVGSYVYNGRGERVVKTASGITTHFHYGLDGQLLAETDDTGAQIREYVYLHGAPLALIDAAGDVYYYHNDHLGTPQVMTNANEAVVWEGHYTPFGTVDEAEATVTNPLRFPGQYFDEESGTHYNYFRDYDPSTGRYLTSDPIGLEGGVNSYAYVENAPTVLVDPSGLVGVAPVAPGIFPPPCGQAGGIGGIDWTASWFGSDSSTQDAERSSDSSKAKCPTKCATAYPDLIPCSLLKKYPYRSRSEARRALIRILPLDSRAQPRRLNSRGIQDADDGPCRVSSRFETGTHEYFDALGRPSLGRGGSIVSCHCCYDHPSKGAVSETRYGVIP